jgi:hypothetical protein
MNQKRRKFTKILDDTINMPKKSGNGILKLLVSVDENGNLARYSLTYINPHLCNIDNGRVLGYDNCHGYHHRHYMGKEELVDFKNYETIAKKFDSEWRSLHEKAKKHYR